MEHSGYSDFLFHLIPRLLALHRPRYISILKNPLIYIAYRATPPKSDAFSHFARYVTFEKHLTEVLRPLETIPKISYTAYIVE